MLASSLKGSVFESDGLESDIADLQGEGVRIGASYRNSAMGRFVTFDDPDGNGIVLLETTAL
jgi:predicted enzyme related to lactoylglutathione lyase